MPIPLKSPRDLDAQHAAGRACWRALEAVIASVRPGITTHALDVVARREVAAEGAEPILSGYRAGGAPPFPGAICVSINEEVVHGIPRARIVRDGDVVTIDLALRLAGWCADAARTVVVGESDTDRRALAAAVLTALDRAIEMVRPGVPWSSVAAAIEELARSSGLGVVRGYSGHGIGRELHEAPRVPSCWPPGTAAAEDFTLRPGMVLTIEPIFVLGGPRVEGLDDGWTVVTTDRSPACHEERTVAVTRSGPRVLTGP